MSKLLCLDLSTKASGYAIFDYEKKELIESGVIYPEKKSAQVLERICSVSAQINSLIARLYTKDREIKILAEEVILQDLHNNPKTAKPLLYLQGMVSIVCHRNYNLPVSFVVASHWRKNCGIKTGRYEKRDTLKKKSMKLVQEIFGKTVSDDEADAICIGISELGLGIGEIEIEEEKPKNSFFRKREG